MQYDILKNGSTWVKADFHLHTLADKEFHYVQSDSDRTARHDIKNTFPDDYVQTLKKNNIRIGIITNHNKFDKGEFICLRKKAEKEQIFLLPGIELGVKEGRNGVHTLVVFSDEWISDGNDFIKTFLDASFRGQAEDSYQNENGKTANSLLETVRLLDEYKKAYFIIFAHVEQN